MDVERDEVPLSPIPDNYQLVSSLPFSMKLMTIAYYVYFTFTVIWITLVRFGLLGDGAFQGRFAGILGCFSIFIVLFTSMSVSTVHVALQRWMSRLRGYIVRFDLFLFDFSGPYLAEPGQFLSRGNGFVIVASPFVLFLLLLFPLFFLPPGVVRTVLGYMIVVNLLGSTYDLYLVWRLCKMSKGTVLYVESLKNILIFETTPAGVSGENEHDVTLKPVQMPTTERPTPSAWQWTPVASQDDTKRKEISPDDEEILMQEYVRNRPSKISVRIIQWTTRLRLNDVFGIATDADANFRMIMSVLVDSLDVGYRLIHIKFFDAEAGDLADTQIIENEEQATKMIEQTQLCEIKSIVYSGFLYPYPVIILVRLQRMSQDQTHIEITGVAKKIWRKQSTAEKAVRVVAQWCEDTQGSETFLFLSIMKDTKRPLLRDEMKIQIRNETMPIEKKIMRILYTNKLGRKYWDGRLMHPRVILAISAFGGLLSFLISAFYSLFQYDTSPGAYNDRAVSLAEFWVGFLGYLVWKIYEFFIRRYRIDESRSYGIDSTLRQEIRSVLSGIAHIKSIRILLVFGILYTLLINILWALKM